MHIPLSFTKMHGLGNSYIYIDARQHKIPSDQLPELAIKVSDPGVGIGSDGLIIIEPSGRATVKMRMFNKDGSEGNAAATACAASPNTPLKMDTVTAKR